MTRFALLLLAFTFLAPSFGGDQAADKGLAKAGGPVAESLPPSSPRAQAAGGGGDAGFGECLLLAVHEDENGNLVGVGPKAARAALDAAKAEGGYPTKVGAMTEGGTTGPNGKEILCDVPEQLRKENIASKGLGCCVFRSIDYASIYHSLPQLRDFPEWMVQNRIEGGGYPEKVDKLIPKICQDRGLPVPDYVQHTGGDIQFLWSGMKGNRICCVTYAGSDMHYRQGIDHMVCIVYMDQPGTPGGLVCVLDNNFPNNGQLVWMSEQEFTPRWKARGGGWAIAFLAPPPPPVPHT